MPETDLTRHLPLRPTAFAVLAALSRAPLTGVDVLEEAGRSGVTILGPGTLYRLMRELRQEGWIERVPPPAESAGEGDARRQHHALTERGRALLLLEADRLRRTLDRLGAERAEPAG